MTPTTNEANIMVRSIYSINIILAMFGFVMQAKKSAFILPRLFNNFNFAYLSQFLLVSIFAITLLVLGGKRFIDICKGNEKLSLYTDKTSYVFLYNLGVSFLLFNLIRVTATIYYLITASKGGFHISLIGQSFAFLMPAGFIILEFVRLNSLREHYELT